MAWGHVKRVNIETTPTEQTRNTGKHAKLVLNQNRDGMSHIKAVAFARPNGEISKF